MLIDPNNVIVCQKHKQTMKQKMLGICLHILFWGILLYIFFTFLVVFGYFLGYSFSSQIFIDYRDIEVIQIVIKRYFPFIGMACGVFLLWALYNKVRFHGKRNRRKNHPAPVSLLEVASTSKVDIDEVKNIRQAKVMVCMFDDDGNIISVKCKEPIPPIELKEEIYLDIEIPVPEKEKELYNKIWA